MNALRDVVAPRVDLPLLIENNAVDNLHDRIGVTQSRESFEQVSSLSHPTHRPVGGEA